MPVTAGMGCLLLAFAGWARPSDLLDIAPSGQITAWNSRQTRRFATVRDAVGNSNLGIEWDEERDVRELRVRYAGNAPRGGTIEYWFKNWPYDPPKMPTFEDPMDDPWQGAWLKASASESCEGAECVYRFEPLTARENTRAKNLPAVTYRRTLKVKLVFPQGTPAIEYLRVYSGTEQQSVSLRVELAQGDTSGAQWSGSVSVYNGLLRSVRAWQFSQDDIQADYHWSFHSARSPKGLLLDIIAAKPDLPGSHDLTVVTIHAVRKNGDTEQNRSFSFAVDDLKHGPISIPELQARIMDVSSAVSSAKPQRLRVRERIPLEPEQTYERASREIPPLDPWERESGGRVYLPLAPDSDWQKFAFEYGGNVFVSKSGIKAKGRELDRLQWAGDRITWKIGTGVRPYYRDDRKVIVEKMDGYLPVVTQRWAKDGVGYSEEAYATLLRGELSPQNRDEETPAILMLKLSAQNQTGAATKVHAWLSIDMTGPLTTDGKSVRIDGKLVAYLTGPAGTDLSVSVLPGSAPQQQAIHITYDLQSGRDGAVVLKLPCVSDLQSSDVESLDRLDYASERQRVGAYWKQITQPAVRFAVPEPKFNLLAKTVVAQIHISTTKDPRTGLYMVPAASYVYDVFENESCYQVLLLDTLGQFETAAQYLETMLKLQGSKNFPGLQTGSTEGIFHGAKIDTVYDYTAHGYGLDHGTVLWTLAEHYLYSRDQTWLKHAWPHMQKAIDWIEEQRAATKLTDTNGAKVREYGLLPASQLEDNADWANWFSINAFAWAGMQRTAEALTDIRSPEAAQIQQKANEYRNDLRSAILRAIENAPVVRMQDGTYEPYVPVLPTRRFRLFGPIRADYYDRYGHSDVKPLLRLGADRDTLCGAVVLLILGVFSPNEPIANWILDDWEDNETLTSGMGMNIHGMTDDRYWFSQGGMVFQANLMNPIQVYLLRHEASAAIRNLYNDFVACLYPEVNMFTEEYHQWRHGSGPFYKISDESRFVNRVRDTLVFEHGDTLWLAPGAPRRWLSSPDGIAVNDVQTFFGPVSYTLKGGRKPGVIEATVKLPTRNPPKKVRLVARVPRGRIRSVSINGKPWTAIDTKLEAIDLPQQQGPMQLEIQYN